MPRCPSCHEKSCPEGLVPVNGILACCECRKLKVVPSDQEDRMSDETKERKLVDLQVTEFETHDGGKDHRITISAKAGSMLFQFNTTVDNIRKFFTENRKRNEARKLKSV